MKKGEGCCFADCPGNLSAILSIFLPNIKSGDRCSTIQLSYFNISVSVVLSEINAMPNQRQPPGHNASTNANGQNGRVEPVGIFGGDSKGKTTCFVISPIGMPGTEIREHADVVFWHLICRAFLELDRAEALHRGEQHDIKFNDIRHGNQ